MANLTKQTHTCEHDNTAHCGTCFERTVAAVLELLHTSPWDMPIRPCCVYCGDSRPAHVNGDGSVECRGCSAHTLAPF